MTPKQKALLVIAVVATPLLLGLVSGATYHWAQSYLTVAFLIANLPLTTAGTLLSVYVGLGHGLVLQRLVIAFGAMLVLTLGSLLGFDMSFEFSEFGASVVWARLSELCRKPWAMNEAITGGMLFLCRPWAGVITRCEETPDPNETRLRVFDLMTATVVAALLLAWRQMGLPKGVLSTEPSQFFLTLPYFLFLAAQALGVALLGLSERRLVGAAIATGGLLGSQIFIMYSQHSAGLSWSPLEYLPQPLTLVLAIAAIWFVRRLGWRLRLPEKDVLEESVAA
ncbi:hypothetical protein Mal64_39020 [Pseudobythopirellula maris]|uniref:Uncharacterized protein n=1 Tax=Pseudobythopirellula maris TaxID=2527991 RepID=A0A5C5ZFR4_9BACT|nr:hypothetical protein [Pseudobythopirellula maris]TWT86162.1 hypothetical protein Mal64_39020 [Pseudobythopirellula maris]